MHFWQAIKMAVKSLKSNKLRSFLTMLGIIIGVMTVSLLTSVAQGVTDVVVSSVRSQSTLAVFVNMNPNLKIYEADSIVKQAQPTDKDADDYFEYSLIYSNSSVVANNSYEVVSAGELTDYLTQKKIYTKDDFPNYDSLPSEQQGIIDLLIMQSSHVNYYGTTIYEVDENFSNVYEFEIDGRKLENSNDILVDSRFVKGYFGENTKNSDVLNKEITLGIVYYTKIVCTFGSDESFQTNKDILLSYIQAIYNQNLDLSAYSENVQTQIESIISTVKFIPYGNNEVALVNEDEKTITIKIELSNISNEILASYLNLSLQSQSINDVGITIDDDFDTSKAKTYVIAGIISDNTSSLVASMTSSMENSNSSNSSNTLLLTYMSSMSSTIGECYMLLNDDNVSTFGEKNVASSKISYIYFRYKNEDVMSASTTNLILKFAKNEPTSYMYMKDFMLISFSSVANIISKIMNILTIMLTVISVISLIVGGIGIMNIMLVAVTERTREIGIRKAIGAKKSSILTQFLVEALMLSILGGLIGLGISAIGMMIISHFMGVILTIPLWVIGMSVGFCTAIGLIFGMFPAVKASNMQPIDALRRD